MLVARSVYVTRMYVRRKVTSDAGGTTLALNLILYKRAHNVDFLFKKVLLLSVTHWNHVNHLILAMPRSEEAASWYTMVYRAVQQIPPGSVTSYGHIATLLGYP